VDPVFGVDSTDVGVGCGVGAEKIADFSDAVAEELVVDEAEFLGVRLDAGIRRLHRNHKFAEPFAKTVDLSFHHSCRSVEGRGLKVRDSHL
jgi:hypothetical protein